MSFLLSATPIPRTMMMSFMVIWIFQKLVKNQKEKKIITFSKPEKKIYELWPFIKNKLIKKIKFFGFVH